MPTTIQLTVPDGTDIKDISFAAPVPMWVAQEASMTQAATNLNAAHEQLKTANERIQTLMKELEDSHVATLRAEIIDLEKANAGLQTTNKQQSDKLRDAVEVDKQNDVLQKEFGAAMQYIQGLHEALEDVFAKLLPGSLSGDMLALYNVWQKKPAPPPVVVPPVVPVTAKRPWVPLYGVYVEDPRPTDNVDDAKQAKEHAAALIPAIKYLVANSPVRDVITHLNSEDLKWAELPSLMRDLKVRFWQSPMQAGYDAGFDGKYIGLLQGLHAAGMYGGFIDDAQNITPSDMNRMIDLIEKYCPGAVVVCSFAADFDDHKAGYPFKRYVDSRQWFLDKNESAPVWFKKWETAQDAQIYTGDTWRRDGGFMHTPEAVESMLKVALPFVQGVVFYSLLNKRVDHVAEHKAARVKDVKAKTIFSVIADGAAEYMKQNKITAQEVVAD